MFEGDPGLHIGTSSWSSKDWVGPFYPPGTTPTDYISHYSTVYDTVEIDATFYRMPTITNVDAWRNRTPDGFKFAIKTPRIITHDKVLEDVDDDMGHFLEVISKLEDRLGPILFQFPYFNRKAFTNPEPFLERLATFLEKLPTDFRFAVEVRNKAWVKAPLQEICSTNNVALAWVEQAWMPKANQWFKLTGGPTADFAYIRFLGDHKGIEKLTKNWDKTVVDQTSTIREWTSVISELRKKQIETFGFFNNHFAGHAPDSVEAFRQLISSI